MSRDYAAAGAVQLAGVQRLMDADVARWAAEGCVLSPSGTVRAPAGSEQALRWDEARGLAEEARELDRRAVATAKRQGIPIVRHDGVAVLAGVRKPRKR